MPAESSIPVTLPPTDTEEDSVRTDQFLSEEDLDLKNLSWDELIAVWNAWLRQATATDEQDAKLYSHGVFTEEP